ncbi:MAG: Isoleucine--tRNA ligase [Cryomorphaceae bacterium]|nr:MAG: Isoleucine--tRNA ligase [Cryomorphaceae bacterium]
MNRLQNLRKSSGLEVTDRISITISASDEFQQALSGFEAYVKDEVLSDRLDFGATEENSTEVEGHEICISIHKN